MKIFIPGSFKFPHMGHFELITSAIRLYPQEKITILISSPQSIKTKRLCGGKEVTAELSCKIFKAQLFYLNNFNLVYQIDQSPIKYIKDLILMGEPPSNIKIIVSHKEDTSRYSLVGKYQDIEIIKLPIKTNISGSEIRSVIEKTKKENLKIVLEKLYNGSIVNNKIVKLFEPYTIQ
jgi:hypothetical protein